MAEVVEHKPSFDSKTFVGKEICNIVLLELIGQGAMGAVFIGYQKSLKRKVAIKVFPKKVAAQASCRVHFREEAETVAVLNHPHIVPVFDMGENEQFLYIVMQLIEGEDLRMMITRHQLHPIPSRRLIGLAKGLSIMIPVLDALAFAHQEGVIHQDVKPGNILVEERTGRPYLADFGIARSAMTEGCETFMVLGTPLYIAPEQIGEEEPDERSDLYSAGIVLYELLAGKLPFQKTTVEALLSMKINNPEALFTATPSAWCPRIDRELETIILKAIAPQRAQRYQTVAGFNHDLIAYQQRHGLKDLA